MPETADTAFSQAPAPQSSQADEIRNNVDILMAGSGVMQPRTAQAPEARGSDAVAYKARVAQLERAARRLVELAGNPDREANQILADSLKRVSARNFPDSVQRMLEPVLAKIPPQATQPFPPKHPSVQNPDGTTSNVKTSTVEIDGRHYVIPTMVGGEQLEAGAATDVAIKQGLHKYPSFGTADEALQSSVSLHDKQAPPEAFDPKVHREAAARKALE